MYLKTTLRTLLLTAGLTVGAGAWADDEYTTVYQRTSWTADDVTAWGSATNLAISSTTATSGYFGFESPSSTSSATYGLTITSNAKVKYEAEWYIQSTYGGSGNVAYSTLQLGSLVMKVWDNLQNNVIAFSTDGGSTYGSDLSTKKTSI